MSEAKQLPLREEVPVVDTWDLTLIFQSDDEVEAAFVKITEALKQAESYKETLKKGAKELLYALEYILATFRDLETLYVYSHLKNDQDTANNKYQALYSRVSSLAAQTSEAVSWFEPELLTLSDDTISSYFNEEPQLVNYRHYIDNLISNRAHVLSEKEEALLAGSSEIFGTASDTFSVLNNADLVFPTIKGEDGETIQLSHGLYGQLMESTNRKVREDAFKALYSVYDQFRNTFATTLASNVKVHNFRSKVRKFTSAREAAMSSNHIPESVYDTLLTVVKESQPLLQRYVKLRKQLLGVDAIHMYDMYTPILGEAPIKYTYSEAKEIALKALQPLGDDYIAKVSETFDSRWIDVVENKGKRSGAYSSGAYDTAPYILMNWHDSLDQLYTLVHEMGHSIHSFYTRTNQPYVYGDYSIFLAEIASTTNENLLTEYLLKTETDSKVRAYILNHYLDGFKGTVFRQTQFAEFEYFVHEQDAKGMPLTSDFLSEYYSDLNSDYYGEDVVRDDEIALEWSRIPHFYYNFYVYQYATGFSAASALSERILTGKSDLLELYLGYLKAGSSDYPIEVMKKAGVDMTNRTYIDNAMKIFEERLAELEKLVVHLNN